jgi:UDP-N-acetylmuramoylalanine--D-glutamate ligase
MLGAPMAGNVGRALTDLDGQVEPGEWVVCEVSSFQLEDVHEFRPRIAVLLNLEPDHLDRHGTFDDYRSAKLRVFERQTPEDVAIAPRAFGELPGRASRIEFTWDDPLPAEPLIPGAHNRENAVAATAAAQAAGASEDAIADALRTFPGVEHRLELVAEWRGVRFVNDSKATNTSAARRGISAFEEPLHLILGGSLKGEGFDGLVGDLPERVRSIHLIGEASDPLAAALDRAGRSYQRDDELATAVATAARAARPGEIVLLSPACASYDQFANFEERGEEFRRLVQNLPE